MLYGVYKNIFIHLINASDIVARYRVLPTRVSQMPTDVFPSTSNVSFEAFTEPVYDGTGVVVGMHIGSYSCDFFRH